MALLGTINKQPSEILDFDINYTATLAAGGDTLTTCITSVSPPGSLTVDSADVNAVTNKVKVKFSGGTSLVTYKITVLMNTANGLKYEDEVSVIVEDV